MDYREKCLAEKPHRCVVCGSEDNIVVHHVDGDRSNNSVENLEPMCSSCHSRLHNSNGDLKEWQERLLPERERKRTLSITLTKELSKDLKLVEETSPADTLPEAAKWVIRHRADAVTSLREQYDDLEELRRDPQETDAKIIQRALSYRVTIEESLEELLDRAVEEGSLTAAEITAILDARELPVAVETEVAIGDE